MINISTPAPALKNVEKITHFRGINKQADATSIENNQAANMLNMQLDSQGTLQRFLGYKRVFPDELVGSNYGLFFNPKINKFIVSNGGNLYTFVEGENPSMLYSDVALAPMESFFMNDKQYFQDGTNYLQLDGNTVTKVEDNAYVPTLTMGRTPTGGGEAYEAFNLLTPKFKDSFSATTATAYTLSLKNLDSAYVKAWINGVEKYELTDFTVNRITGVVTFTSSPATGTNNLIIQAEKTIDDCYEVASLTITSGATKTGNVTISLDGVTRTVGVTSGDTAINVADNIRGLSFPKWEVSGELGTNEVIFTATEYGDKQDLIYDQGITGAKGTITTAAQISLTVYTPATLTGNITITLNDVPKTISVTKGNSATYIASKIRGTTFTNWKTGGTGTKVTFTPNTYVDNQTLVYDEGETGIKASVIITSQGSYSYQDKIRKCNLNVVYGGDNDTRLFFSGNPTFKSWDFRSGLLDPTYFPDTGFTRIGSDATAIKGYSKQYDTCLIFKEDSNHDSTVFIRSFELKDDGSVLFPIIQGNAGIGVKASKTIRIVEDSPLFLSDKGVYRFTGGNVKNQNSMRRMSDYLEPNILDEANSDQAISFNYDGKYGICFPSGNVYVFDYRNKFVDTDGVIKYEGYIWNGINAKSFLEVNGTLYFADSIKGLVHKLLKPSDTILYEYDGNAYDSCWYGKVFSFEADNYKKLVERVDFTLSPTYTRNSAELWLRTNKKEETFIKEYRLVLFDFNDIDFNDFDFLLSSFGQPCGKKVKQKKIIYFQPIFKCSKVHEAMTINNITLQYLLQSPIR